MEILKYIILFFIFGTTSFIGILISKKYSNRVKELQEMKSALSMFESKIKFRYEPIPEIFKEISNNFSEHIEEIFKNSEVLIDKLNRQLIQFISIAILITVVIYFMFLFYIRNPLKRLTQNTISFSMGNYRVRNRYQSNNEIGDLSKAFNNNSSPL